MTKAGAVPANKGSKQCSMAWQCLQQSESSQVLAWICIQVRQYVISDLDILFFVFEPKKISKPIMSVSFASVPVRNMQVEASVGKQPRKYTVVCSSAAQHMFMEPSIVFNTILL